jgi:MOSC domain-containing protein YiiM
MADHDARYRLLSVQVGKAAPLQAGDRRVMSGIAKRSVQGAVGVSALGLDGDEQADLSVHGGLSKAVYAYPVEHYGYWREQRRLLGLDPELPHGSLGENLTVAGLLESDLYVGDQLRFPDCVLRVTQPRQPCFKFAAVMGDPRAGRKMVQTGFCGYYLAVDSPGSVAPGQTFELREGPREMPLMTLFPSPRART